jgi:hypothetical protein
MDTHLGFCNSSDKTESAGDGFARIELPGLKILVLTWSLIFISLMRFFAS